MTEMLENVTFAELRIGQSAELKRRLTQRDIDLFAAVSGDVNPAHMDRRYAADSLFHDVVGHGMWSGGLISTVLGTMLPGPGTIYLQQDMRFQNPVMLGDEITVRVAVRSKQADKPIVVLDCICLNDRGETVVEGTAAVLAPTQKVRVPRPSLPSVELQGEDHLTDFLQKYRRIGPLKVAVVHPVQANVIEATAEAVAEKLIDPVLIGPENRIRAAIAESGLQDREWRILHAAHSHAAAAAAAEMAVRGDVGALMKGSLHTDELLETVLPSDVGLRTERRISHVYLMNIPTYRKPLMITDAAVNISPTLEQKADICRNAIDAWHVLFNHEKGDPKVAILSATEEVTGRIPSTIDAAALCKMADRGQITGARLDGPLAFDNAISAAAVKDKNIISDVAGDADILVVPNIEAGNVLAKQLIFLGKAEAAGILLGARVPIILTSRADSKRTRLFSCAVALALSAAQREGRLK